MRFCQGAKNQCWQRDLENELGDGIACFRSHEAGAGHKPSNEDEEKDGGDIGKNG